MENILTSLQPASGFKVRGLWAISLGARQLTNRVNHPFSCNPFPFGKSGLASVIYVITKPIHEHSQILPQVVSRTLWITGILFPFLLWVWNSISYEMEKRSHTTLLFTAQSSWPCFRQHTVAGATWSEDQRWQLRQTQIQNLYLLIMLTVHTPIKKLLISLLPPGWLHFTASLKVADRVAGRGMNQIISEETCEWYPRSYSWFMHFCCIH